MPILPTNLWLLQRNQPTIVVFHYAMGIHVITTNWNTKLREEWLPKIRGHEGSDFKLFQELCLTRSKVETFKILRLFGVKKKPWLVGSRRFKDEDYLLPNTSGRQLLKGGVVPFKFDWSSNFKARRKIIRHVERYWWSIASIPVMPL